MHIGSGLNTVSSMYRQQKGNNMKTPASGEKTFYTAETPKVYQIFTTDNMLWTGGNGTGLSYCLKYADDSTDENPVVLAKGVDENGKSLNKEYISMTLIHQTPQKRQTTNRPARTAAPIF